MTDSTSRWQPGWFTELALSPESIRESYLVELRPERVAAIDTIGTARGYLS
jgi:hypothetical protein